MRLLYKIFLLSYIFSSSEKKCKNPKKYSLSIFNDYIRISCSNEHRWKLRLILVLHHYFRKRQNFFKLVHYYFCRNQIIVLCFIHNDSYIVAVMLAYIQLIIFRNCTKENPTKRLFWYKKVIKNISKRFYMPLVFYPSVSKNYEYHQSQVTKGMNKLNFRSIRFSRNKSLKVSLVVNIVI